MKPASAVQIWSAAPTPLLPDLTVDAPSVRKMIRAAKADGIAGVFLAGTCGEGPWLSDRERNRLVAEAVKESGGIVRIAVQVTDNSVPRILENIRQVAAEGADCAIVAPPPVFMNATPERVAAHFIEAADLSPLPVGIYDTGRHRSVAIAEDRLMEVYLRPKVVLVKDSSGSPSRREAALAARREKPGLALFNGDEFKCLEYLQAGYDGCMFGGAAAIARPLARIVALFAEDRLDEARTEEAAMKAVLYGIYGGENIACWLTGLKYYLVCRGLFSSTASYLGYPLTDNCRDFIETYAEAGFRTGG